jgi:hypothetical protein
LAEYDSCDSASATDASAAGAASALSSSGSAHDAASNSAASGAIAHPRTCFRIENIKLHLPSQRPIPSAALSALRRALQPFICGLYRLSNRRSTTSIPDDPEPILQFAV